MPADVIVERPTIVSDEEYARLVGDIATWEPMARAALDLTGIPQPAELRIAHPLGTYPTLLTGSPRRLVIKLFGDRYSGPESHATEYASYEILGAHDLPVPDLIAAGDLFPGAPDREWTWPFLILTELPGGLYAELAPGLDGGQRATIAGELGELLRRLHGLPLPPPAAGWPLASSWDRFMMMLQRRRREASGEQRRLGLLPPHLCEQLDGWLPDPDQLVDKSRAPVFVHGDLHAEHVFVDPEQATLAGIIDFTDAYAGDCRYDLVALHVGTFGLDPTLLRACLEAYGWEPDGDWPRDMLAFTLLHDFNMFRADIGLDRFSSLDGLANAIWDC